MGMNVAGNRAAQLSTGNYLNGWSEYTITSWIKSNIIDSDEGWFNTVLATDRRDRFAGLRYDRRGWLASNNTIDVLKFGIEVNGNETTVESREFAQTTTLQHVVGRWRSGEAPEIFIDNDDSNPTAVMAPQTGTLTNQPGMVVGRGIQETGTTSFNGIIYDLRLYNVYLSNAELNAIYYGQGSDDIYRGLQYWYKTLDIPPGGVFSVLKDWSDSKLDLPASNNPVGVENPIGYRRR